MDRALERSQVVGNGVGGFGLALLENVVVAGDIERELLLLIEFFVGGVPRVLSRPVSESVAALADGYLAATADLRGGNYDSPWK